MNSQAEISIVLATRTGATEYQGPLKLLTEMENTLLRHHRIEVIIRGDDDDAGFDPLIQQIKAKKYSFKIVFIKGQRGRGYEDLHNFYNDCLLYTSNQKKIIFSLPEDVAIKINHWDQMLLDEYDNTVKKLGHRVFTMHQSLHPGLGDNFEATLENPDFFPMYSADWMQAVGGFGHTSANDSWVQATHYYLLKKFGLHLRHFLPGLLFDRAADSQDSIANPRWANARLRNHDLLRSQRTRDIFKSQAEVLRSLACHQMTQSNEKKADIIEQSHVMYYASKQYGTVSVLYKSMYNVINSATIETIDQLVHTSDALANELFTLKRVAPMNKAESAISGEVEELHTQLKHSIGISHLSYQTNQKTRLALKNISLAKLFYYYCVFKIQQHRINRGKKHKQASAQKYMLNNLFWKVRIKPLINLIIQSKCGKKDSH